MDFKTIIFKREGHIGTIVLNRPEVLNAVTAEMIEEIKTALEQVAKNNEIRVLVLTGAGRGFCAGADIKVGGMKSAEIPEDATLEEARDMLSSGLQEVTRRLQRLEMPTIAMVNGVAAGLGFEWALACDLRIGSENARFMVAFTRIGAVPGAGGPWLMPRIVGMAKAAELIFTGDLIEAEEAERIGILNRLVSAQDLEKETTALAQKIANNPPIAIRMDKMLLNRSFEIDLDTALQMIAALQPILLSTEDWAEGVTAFREGRKPVFRGR
jgi:enoyl-CoA hydratase/carnithine racemase